MIDTAIQELAEREARRHDLNPAWVLGIIAVESGGDTYAWNPEPHYRYLWDISRGKPFRALSAAERASEIPPRDFPCPPGVDRDAEWWGQQASWGLMQVMGAVAREMGYAGRHLPGLCAPAVGLAVGCQFLSRLMNRYGQPEPTIAAYNAGSPRLSAGGGYENQQYVDKVLAAAGGWLNA